MHHPVYNVHCSIHHTVVGRLSRPPETPARKYTRHRAGWAFTGIKYEKRARGVENIRKRKKEKGLIYHRRRVMYQQNTRGHVRNDQCPLCVVRANVLQYYYMCAETGDADAGLATMGKRPPRWLQFIRRGTCPVWPMLVFGPSAQRVKRRV